MNRIVTSFTIALLLGATTVYAHGPWVGPGADNIACALYHILDPHQSFSATADCKMSSPHAGEYLNWTMSVSMLDGKLRSEIDSANNVGIPARDPEEVARNKAMNISHVVTIFEPEKPIVYIYPELNASTRASSAIGSCDVVTSNINIIVSNSMPNIEFTTSDGTCIIEFNNITLTPPAPELFTPAVNSRNYDSIIDVVRFAGHAYYEKQGQK